MYIGRRNTRVRWDEHEDPQKESETVNTLETTLDVHFPGKHCLSQLSIVPENLVSVNDSI